MIEGMCIPEARELFVSQECQRDCGEEKSLGFTRPNSCADCFAESPLLTHLKSKIPIVTAN